MEKDQLIDYLETTLAIHGSDVDDMLEVLLTNYDIMLTIDCLQEKVYAKDQII